MKAFHAGNHRRFRKFSSKSIFHQCSTYQTEMIFISYGNEHNAPSKSFLRTHVNLQRNQENGGMKRSNDRLPSIFHSFLHPRTAAPLRELQQKIVEILIKRRVFTADNLFIISDPFLEARSGTIKITRQQFTAAISFWLPLCIHSLFLSVIYAMAKLLISNVISMRS